MKTSDFDFHLPDELIAKYPLEKRTSSRLLVFSNEIEHKSFKDIVNYFEKGDLLVVNNTAVIPARVFGQKDSGGLVEVMLERIMEDNRALVQIRSSRSPKIGTKLNLENYTVECIDRKENFYVLQFDLAPMEVFNSIGHVPLPPYIKRPDESIGKSLNEIKERGVNIAEVNLRVGSGTFQPVKAENIKDHNIHEEYIEVSKKVLDLVDKTRDNQKKVVAVGTTTTRALETAYLENLKNGYSGYTKLFIYPGYKFKVVDRLITNFHMPQSSLLMLVSAFIGFDNMKYIYKTAIEERYRFLSYGDVMLLNKNEI